MCSAAEFFVLRHVEKKRCKIMVMNQFAGGVRTRTECSASETILALDCPRKCMFSHGVTKNRDG